MTLNLDQILQVHLAGDLALAEKAYRYLLNQPNPDTLVLINLAAICYNSNRLEEATRLLEEVLSMNPNSPEACNNLGKIYQDLEDYERAVVLYRKAILYKKAFVEAHYNLGNTLFLGLKDYKGAIYHYELAVLQDSTHYNARVNLAMTLLLTGNFQKGWKEYEFRLQRTPELIEVPLVIPKWNGDLSYDGVLVLVYEQGLGDTMQFLRYILDLNKLGMRLIVVVQDILLNLVSYSVQELLRRENAETHNLINVLGVNDWKNFNKENMQWFPLMSLPFLLGTTVDKVPSNYQYMFVPRLNQSYWEARFGKVKKMRIAVAWCGNPAHELSHNKGRSFPLEALSELAKIPNVEFVSVQKFAGSEQLETCSFKDKFIHCQDEISASTDFLDTAAIMQQCDLVISSDTSVAHLAGSLGLKTWLVLKKVPEWRWMLEGTTTPWYPSMKLFRQKQNGVWDTVFKEMAFELKNTLNLAA